MSERRPLDWLRRLTGGRAGAPAPDAGIPAPLVGGRALRTTEERIGATIFDAEDRRVWPTAAAAIAAARGAAMSGLRATAFVHAEELFAARAALAAAAAGQVPLVVHAACAARDGAVDGHDGLAAVPGTGALVLVARDAQEAVDLALAARLAAEAALAPVVVAADAPETLRGVDDVRLPAADAVPDLVRADRMASPTAAQAILLGDDRPRVPRWFDPDRPAAHGVELDDDVVDAVAAGRRILFATGVETRADEALATVGTATGRPLAPVLELDLGNAELAVVASGAAAAAACSIARRLRASGRRVGVLSLVRRHPFPSAAVRDALAHVPHVVVLERSTAPDRSGAGLAAAVRAALSGSGVEVVERTHARLTRRIVALAFDGAPGDAEGLPRHLGNLEASRTTAFPKRAILLERVARAYPAVETRERDADAAPGGVRRIALVVRSAAFPEAPFAALAAACEAAAPGRRRSRAARCGPDLWRLAVALGEAADPSDDGPLDCVVVGDQAAGAAAAVLVEAREGGTLVLARGVLLPPAVRDVALARRLAVWRVDAEALAGAAQAFLAGAAIAGESIDLARLATTEPVRRAPELPMAVRRFGTLATTYDSVARFWGEYEEPRLAGESAAAVEPHLALAALPACTATFTDRTVERELVPELDPSRCTGCGVCWSSCPDAAIAPVAVGVESLLETAIERARARGAFGEEPIVARFARARRQLATRIDGLLAGGAACALDAATFGEAAVWLCARLDVADGERAVLDAAIAAVRAEIEPLALAATEALFHDPHRETRGAGELLLLAIDPRACQSCGICVAACPEGALRRVPQTAAVVARMRAAWEAWERLPDTPGRTVERAAAHPRIGRLPAILMSRHTLFALAGGDSAEPGSGERIVTRQVAACFEYHGQRATVQRLAALDRLVERLDEALREALACAARVEDLGHLEAALAAPGAGRGGFAELIATLEALGERPELDRQRLRDLVALSREVGELRARVAAGPSGVGRARFGVVVAGPRAADWAARFPANAFAVPVAVDLATGGADLALGLGQALAADCAAEARLVRRAELEIERPADRRARARALATLDWTELSAEERRRCMPLLVVLHADDLGGATRDGLARLLGADWPIRVLLLDGRDLGTGPTDPTLAGLAARRAFVLATSIADPRHLAEGLEAALEFPAAALIHVHAPSPRRHGFATDQTIERARAAVASRVHPLLRYDPSAPGVFGLRIGLDGNPEPERPWAHDASGEALTPAHWARGEARWTRELAEIAGTDGTPVESWSEMSPDARDAGQPIVSGPRGTRLAVGATLGAAVLERRESWQTLAELAGVTTPFTAAVRERVAAEIAAEHATERAALRAEHEAQLRQLRETEVVRQAARLRERLLRLAGHGA